MAEHEICNICLNGFREPKIIDCHHSFCSNCLEDYVHRTSTNGQFCCPLCRQNIKLPEGGVKEFSCKQQMINGPTLQIQQCDVCLNTQATCRCRDCQQYICDSCKAKHDKFVGCRGHIVVTIKEISKHDLKENSPEKQDAGVKEDISEQSRRKSIHLGDFCLNHSEKKVEIYCKDCLVAVCCKCFVNDHNGHTYLDLQEDDVREEIRDELKTLKEEQEEHINKLQNNFTSLESKLSKVEEAAKSARENVDTHVRNICAKVHEMGESIKEEIQKTYSEENEKFTKQMADIKSLTEDLQSAVKFSTNILEDTSIARVLERLPKVRREADQCRSRKFNIPDVMYPSFTGTEINEAVLRQQLGEVDMHLETRFINTFNINQFKSAENVYGAVTEFHGLPWCVIAKNKPPGDPAFFLCLNKRGRSSNILSCQVDCSLELINQKDKNRSKTRHGTCSLKDFQDKTEMGCNNFTTWDVLTNQDNGFLDSNNNFHIRTILKLMDVKKGQTLLKNK